MSLSTVPIQPPRRAKSLVARLNTLKAANTNAAECVRLDVINEVSVPNVEEEEGEANVSSSSESGIGNEEKGKPDTPEGDQHEK